MIRVNVVGERENTELKFDYDYVRPLWPDAELRELMSTSAGSTMTTIPDTY